MRVAVAVGVLILLSGEARAYRSALSVQSRIRAADWIVVVKAERVPRFAGQEFDAFVQRSVVGSGPARVKLSTVHDPALPAGQLPVRERVGERFVFWLKRRPDGTYRELGRQSIRGGTVRDAAHGSFSESKYLDSLPELRSALTAKPGSVAAAWSKVLHGTHAYSRLVLLDQLRFARWSGTHAVPCLRDAGPGELAALGAVCVELARTLAGDRIGANALAGATALAPRLTKPLVRDLAGIARAGLKGDNDAYRRRSLLALAQFEAPETVSVALAWLGPDRGRADRRTALDAIARVLARSAREQPKVSVNAIGELLEDPDCADLAARVLQILVGGEPKSLTDWKLWWKDRRNRSSKH